MRLYRFVPGLLFTLASAVSAEPLHAPVPAAPSVAPSATVGEAAADPAPIENFAGAIYRSSAPFASTQIHGRELGDAHFSNFQVLDNLNRARLSNGCTNPPPGLARNARPDDAMKLLKEYPLPCHSSRQNPQFNGVLIQEVELSADGAIARRGLCRCLISPARLKEFTQVAPPTPAVKAAASPDDKNTASAADAVHAGAAGGAAGPASLAVPNGSRSADKKKAPVPLPDAKLVNRYFYASEAFNRPGCQCDPAAKKIPRNLALPALGPKFFKTGQHGVGKTYWLVDESTLADGLHAKKIRVKKTGYSTATNSPVGSSRAGWAAISRKKNEKGESLGYANEGKGTLNDPTTIAISPEMASNAGVCQGDLLYDEKHGWLRVEGGCTQSGLSLGGTEGRVDIWRGSASVSELDLVNGLSTMNHFPAALVDRDFAAQNPGPKRKK